MGQGLQQYRAVFYDLSPRGALGGLALIFLNHYLSYSFYLIITKFGMGVLWTKG